ncbi:MAG TPA: type II toxin-antitoxin system RelE/ParE family toxin [Candidatus Sulfotelmatobacter sp.]
MAWTIEYAESAKRELKKLDKPVARRILDFMDERVAKLEDPRAVGKALSGALGALWRYRIGDYRAICEIQDRRSAVLVLHIGHRREVYR